MPAKLQVSDRALSLHQEMIIFDALTTSSITETHGQRVRQGGLTAANLTMATIEMGFHDTCKRIAMVHADVSQHSDFFTIARCIDDIYQAKTEGKTAIIIGLQNGKPVEDDLGNLNVLFYLDLRILQLTYNERNYIGDGCVVRRDGGLSDFGISVVERMAELGIVLDVSHCSPHTCLDAIEASPQPAIISHANPNALFPNPRNKSDDIIRRLAEKGGVIGVCLWSPLLDRGRDRRPVITDLVDSIDYLVQLVGIDHVGIGTDLGEGNVHRRKLWESHFLQNGTYAKITGHLGDWWGFEARYPADLTSVIYLPRITEALMERGYGEEEISKIWGLNFLRVLERVWKV